MKNIFRFLSPHVLTILLVVVLLAAQAYFDLSLPNYTSDLLNVGLQQGGISDAVPTTIRADALMDLELFMSEADVSAVDSAYGAPDSDSVRMLSDSADREQTTLFCQRLHLFTIANNSRQSLLTHTSNCLQLTHLTYNTTKH